MFETRHPSLFFDYFRIPYRLDSPGTTAPEWLVGAPSWQAAGAVWWSDGAAPRALCWPAERADESACAHLLPAALWYIHSRPIYCPLMPDRLVRAWLAETGGHWTPSTPITRDDGEQVAAIWQDDLGNTFLPFDPDAAIRNYWSEGYQQAGGVSWRGRAKRLAMYAYYGLRPAMPRAVQIQLRRLFSRLQAQAHFPRWPLETALHDLYDLLFQLVADVAGDPVPWLAPWPKAYDWALVLTHDVETARGYDHIHLMRGVEQRSGFRSSWNFVPKRYAVEDHTVAQLWDAGFEVGVHGLYHDGRDLASAAILQERLPAIRDYAGRWNATGFRSPATHRVWGLMPQLGFDYDSSYFDTDPFEPQSGGCCSLLPFFNQDLVELPITLAQDHTLFVILSQSDETAWVQKARQIRERGGMALLNTHPDYMLDAELLAAYDRFLREFADDPGVWRALPREVSAWWRRRSQSHLVREGDGWRITGPAATDGRILYAAPTCLPDLLATSPGKHPE